LNIYINKWKYEADVKSSYLDKRYEFAVSLYQLGVLLLYNNEEIYNFKEICENTGLNEQELKRVMKVCIIFFFLK
jgi:cullin 1